MDFPYAEEKRWVSSGDKTTASGDGTVGEGTVAVHFRGDMNAQEDLTLQGLKLEIGRLAYEISQQRQEAAQRKHYDELPEWLDLEQAVALKRGVRPKDEENGGASLTTYRQKLFLQPCCGRNYRLVGGRKCWNKDDVITWLGVTDETLTEYAKNRMVELPDVYKRRGR
jgi:hypothetical protein